MSSTPITAAADLDELVAAIRPAARAVCDPDHTADLVAAALRAHLPTPALLTADQRAGDPDHYAQHVLHVEPDGSFSVVALVWRPGQVTPIHDHVAWCVVGVIDGVEAETRYRLIERDDEPVLVEAGSGENPAGSVCAIAPPGDIHCVRNACRHNAVSMHVYGADINRLGSSVRRNYDLPVVTERPARWVVP